MLPIFFLLKTYFELVIIFNVSLRRLRFRKLVIGQIWKITVRPKAKIF